MSDDKSVRAAQEFARSTRKLGTRIVTMTARVIKDVGSGKGVVLQSVHDEAGKLVESTKLDLADVESQGLPLPVKALMQ